VTARIEWTPQALDDLDDIWLPIAKDNRRPADAVLDRIDAAERRLAEFPLTGVARDEIAPGLRLWPVGNYVVLHRADRSLVTIVRIVWGGRNLRSLF
jgi:toxin ParE1/3/4